MRNILIEFSSAPGRTQGGLCVSENLTAAQFLDMLDVVFSSPGGFQTRFHDSMVPLEASNKSIAHGLCILNPNERGAQILTSDEPYYVRPLSVPDETERKTFRDQVRQRDGRCVITGQINLEAHNGILLRKDIHQLWDDYSIAVSPNDGYRIQGFLPGAWEYHGTVLDPVCRQPGNQLSVVDGLLQWHYEQAVLCNMRGDGGPSFEFDFPAGTDMMGGIRKDPAPGERMEAELFARYPKILDREIVESYNLQPAKQM
ncbi:hypothetical protein BDV27DRAFT_146091 [Aspergillus caelatus]|uniref:HNH nuclease domain-containing protein n=1 Tax=Aspergillus caelatus TaxID=61420 RepID=A0A5N7A0Q0_9EURO|nr:uncharacterized protein BDV27DRAFT_146091 [Aspergillus caelatus]KAE8363444.1 hypothetical protein BDV27DRAFT_146091 [Aspergillus caelatus]